MAETEFGAIDWKSPTPLSSWLGWKTLTNNPTPLSSWLGRPVLQTKPTPSNTLANIRKLSNDSAPLSRALGWSLLKSDDASPVSKKFNWTVLCSGATPLSDKFGWSVLKSDDPTPLSSKRSPGPKKPWIVRVANNYAPPLPKVKTSFPPKTPS